MADPNDEVLRGGFFEANGYHQAFLDGQYHFYFFTKLIFDNFEYMKLESTFYTKRIERH